MPMCIVALAWQVLDHMPLCLISNRDEFYQRPTQVLNYWENSPVIAGKDLQSGGTWMGITASGRWAVITNFRDGLILFIVLWWFSSKPRPRMAVSALFLIGYGIARFVVEFFREPDNGQLFIGWMSKGQFLTLPMILIGLWMMWYAYHRKIYDWGPQKNT